VHVFAGKEVSEEEAPQLRERLMRVVVACATQLMSEIAQARFFAPRGMELAAHHVTDKLSTKTAESPGLQLLLDEIVKLATHSGGAIKKKQGPRQDPINRDAREALANGADRKAIFQAWAQTKKYNLSDPAESKRADEAFRQMLTRKPKSK
jgi:hypothetical protein